ncbi:portal vertex of the head [Synechococcus phage B3]|nr:portal vertex of the head [Synechococcus phage B3]QGT54884.1 portal vertex of the head [Synechococcus phage B23]
MAKLFGFSIDDNTKTSPTVLSPIPENAEDGVDYYLTSGFFSSYVDIEGVYRTEFDLIKRYREMSLHPEVDEAIEDIVNEAIVSDSNDTPVQIELSNLNASDGIKSKIREEFKYILHLLDFDKKCHEIYRNWYVDGRLYYHKVIDLKKPELGIQELRYIDSLKMRYVRQAKKSKTNNSRPMGVAGDVDPMSQEFPEIEEFFIYNPRPAYPLTNTSTTNDKNTESIKFAKDSIVYCTSGLVDRNKNITLSWLNKAIKSLNQLRMIEDSIVIYRMVRGTERRIFYIDVGNMPKVKAEQYLRETMMRYRNKLNYNIETGEVQTDRKFQSLMDDYWLPRREGGRGTEVTTLPGSNNLGELTDLSYFQRKLYKSLGVPSSRIDGESGFNLGRSSEILRDEVKFSKFVGRLRKRFSKLFVDLLRTQLILKNIITPEDWKSMCEHIQFDFLYDNHFAELKESELLTERLNMVAMAEPYVGRYFSQNYLRRNVLRQTDEEILEQDALIEKEIEDGTIPDPNIPVDPETGQPLTEPPGNNIDGDMGKVPTEPGINTTAVEVPKGAEI